MAQAGDHRVVVSANRLDTGVVVWLDGDGRWVLPLSDAATFDQTAAALALPRAQESEAAGVVVGVALVEVALIEGGAVQPVRPRERIRARGPSVRPDLTVAAR